MRSIIEPNDGLVIKVLKWMILGNRDRGNIPIEDSNETPEERDAILKTIDRLHPLVERAYNGTHGCGIVMPSSMFKEIMAYKEREKTFCGRMKNCCGDYWDSFYTYLFGN